MTSNQIFRFEVIKWDLRVVNDDLKAVKNGPGMVWWVLRNFCAIFAFGNLEVVLLCVIVKNF